MILIPPSSILRQPGAAPAPADFNEAAAQAVAAAEAERLPPPNWQGIPPALRPLRAWGFVTSRKLPLTVQSVRERWLYSGRNGTMRLSEPNGWTTYDEVLVLAERGGLLDMIAGPCLAMQTEQRLVCIDLDDPHKKTNGMPPELVAEFVPAALAVQAEVLGAFRGRAFIEQSRSGHGAHILVRGAMRHLKYELGARIEDAGVLTHSDVFCGHQMLYMTGNALPGSLDDVPESQDLLDRFVAEFTGRGLLRQVSGATTAPVASTDYLDTHGRQLGLSDEQVMRALSLASNPSSHGVMVGRQRPNPDWSDQLHRLIGDLDKVTGDPEQVYRLLMQCQWMEATGGERIRNESRRQKAERLFGHELSKARAANNARWNNMTSAQRETHAEVIKLATPV